LPAVVLALIRRLRHPAQPFGARRSASVQKPYKPSGFFLLAFGNTVVRWGVAIYGACTPPCLGRIVVRFFLAGVWLSFLECMLVFVQKRFEVLGLRFEDARDDEYLLQCL
jgi:hypothetical protein